MTQIEQFKHDQHQFGEQWKASEARKLDPNFFKFVCDLDDAIGPVPIGKGKQRIRVAVTDLIYHI